MYIRQVAINSNKNPFLGLFLGSATGLQAPVNSARYHRKANSLGSLEKCALIATWHPEVTGMFQLGHGVIEKGRSRLLW